MILYQYAEYKMNDVSAGETTSIGSYGDADKVARYANTAMKWACGSGVLVAEKTLTPTAPALRYQVAEFLANFCQKVVPVETANAA